MQKLAAACVQLTTGNGLAANIAAAEALVRQAASEGARFIALPENVFFMRGPGDALPVYSMDDHPGVLAAREWARGLGAWILIGSVAVRGDAAGEARCYNRSLLVNPEGGIEAHYDKIHLFDVDVGDGQSYLESNHYIPGTGMKIADIPLGGRGIQARLGLTVCYDVRFPHLFRALAKQGAQIIAVPAAFTRITGEAHWHVLLRARAIENGCYIIAPAQCGTHPGGRLTYGHSLIVDPWGRVLADGGEAPGVIHAVLDMAEVDTVRGRLPSLQHDREFTPLL